MTADEISEFKMHFVIPHYLEKILKDPNKNQSMKILAFALEIGDLKTAKAYHDKDAANEVRENDKNGDGKLSKEDWMVQLQQYKRMFNLKEKRGFFK